MYAWERETCAAVSGVGWEKGALGCVWVAKVTCKYMKEWVKSVNGPFLLLFAAIS